MPGDGVGQVYLVGAGPGDPGLITVRGTECLARAEVVLYDYLTNPALLGYAPRSAELVSLGQVHAGRAIPQDEINRRMVAAARAGKTVVRLKSGDPAVFGRGAEETAVLAAAGIPFEVVPGVTAALAATVSGGPPRTSPGGTSAVALVTGHQREDPSGPELDYEGLGRFPGTIAFYMGLSGARRWSAALIRGGKSPATPVLIVRRASWPDQQAIRATLADVANVIEGQQVRPPAVVLVGATGGRAVAAQGCPPDTPAAAPP